MDYIESDMDFSPLFYKNNSVYIEKSKFLQALGEGIRTVEFLSIMPGNKLYFIEAKSSAPNPDNKADFNKYCDELLEKFQHSLDLFVSKELGINKDFAMEFPDLFIRSEFAEYHIILLLVIRKHKLDWCSDVLDGLQRKTVALRKIWKLDVVVWNGETAQKRRFVSEVVNE